MRLIIALITLRATSLDAVAIIIAVWLSAEFVMYLFRLPADMRGDVAELGATIGDIFSAID